MIAYHFVGGEPVTFFEHPFDSLEHAPGYSLVLLGEIKRIDARGIFYSFARQCALDVIHLWDAPDVVRRYLETGDESIRAAARAAAGSPADYTAMVAKGFAPERASMYAAQAAAGYALERISSYTALTAAKSAAESVARAAAMSATGGAEQQAVAESLAWTAARAVQRDRFKAMVDAAFQEGK